MPIHLSAAALVAGPSDRAWRTAQCPGSQPGDEAAIEVETGLIHPSVAVRDDPRPRDREPVGGDSEIGEQIEILSHAVEVITATSPGLAETLGVGEAVPDRVAFALLVATTSIW